MKVLTRAFVAALAVVSVISLVPSALADEVIRIPVVLRPGVTADVAVHVVVNPNASPSGLDVLIVHGLAQTGATFRPLANALFSEPLGNKVARVLIAELPGHGASDPPVGMMFGDLALEDYATAILGVLDALPGRGLAADVLVGHSMGAVIIQMAQERLVSQGTNLRERFDVRGTVLIAPVIPTPLPWAFADSGAAAAILGQFIRFDPTLGLIVDIPPPIWVAVFYSDRAGMIAAGAPSPAQAAAEFVSFEAFVAGAQTIRLFAPAHVRAGLFGPDSGTVAGVIRLEQDAFFQFPSEHQALYEYLTGDDRLKLFFSVEGPTTVHNMHTFNPEPLLHPIKKVLNSIDRQ